MKSYLHLFRTFGPVLIGLVGLGNDRLRAEDWKERFLTEGLASLGKLEELTFHLQATIRNEDVSARGSKGSSVRECYYQKPWLLDIEKPDWDWDTVDERRKARLPVELVHGINSRYQFGIRRAAKGSFEVTSIRKASEEPNNVGPYSSDSARSLSASWILQLNPFHEWLKADGFVLASVEPIASAGGKILVKIRTTYDYAGEEKHTRLQPTGKFTADVVLDPEDYWRITSVNYVVYGKTDTGELILPKSVRIAYGVRIDGMPVPETVTEVLEMPANSGIPGTATLKSIISGVQKTGSASETEFMLSRFGLPEVDPVTQEHAASRGRGYWVLGLSAIAGLVAVTVALIRKRWRRRNSPSHA